MFGGLSNPEIVTRASCHHTIFPAKYVVSASSRIEELDLFAHYAGLQLDAQRPKIRVLLGSWFIDATLQSQHDALISSGKFHLFLPHPADSRSAVLSKEIKTNTKSIDFERMIAEDIIRMLAVSGYSPVVYGFNSTALINLARFVPVVSIILSPRSEPISSRRLSELGVRRIVCYGFGAENPNKQDRIMA